MCQAAEPGWQATWQRVHSSANSPRVAKKEGLFKVRGQLVSQRKRGAKRKLASHTPFAASVFIFPAVQRANTSKGAKTGPKTSPQTSHRPTFHDVNVEGSAHSNLPLKSPSCKSSQWTKKGHYLCNPSHRSYDELISRAGDNLVLSARLTLERSQEQEPLDRCWRENSGTESLLFLCVLDLTVPRDAAVK
ncbi:Hypothetical predicted protein [Podarcis lilfordi]|uniref:Uncharacterized protein n=1 Tax=Podarcis lilfordi TaxID=74358 RepID=A0AA35PTP3_9SAUR|nr:Hypothetical predicted protein [Podarcis lilfordi]